MDKNTSTSASTNERGMEVELSKLDLLANAIYYACGINPKKRREEILLFFSKIEEYVKKRLIREGAEP